MRLSDESRQHPGEAKNDIEQHEHEYSRDGEEMNQ